MNTQNIRPISGAVNVSQMKEVDQVAVNEYGISAEILMENAAFGLVEMVRSMLGGTIKYKKIIVLAHKGNNGGDGLALSRHLCNYGSQVKVVLTVLPEKLGKLTLKQYGILEKMDVEMYVYSEITNNKLKNMLLKADLVVDALLGYGAKGNPKYPLDEIIDLAVLHSRQILSIDIPSGLDADSGGASDHTIKAMKTLTLGFVKKGLLEQSAQKYTGELWLSRISLPKELHGNYRDKNDLISDKNIEMIKSAD